MANELSINSLLSKFSIPEKGDWINAAIKETGLIDPMADLSWRPTNELSFLPIYDRSDAAAIHYDDAFALMPSTEESRNARFWLNLPPVMADDAGAANKTALDHLVKGADGIFLSQTDNIERRLDGIDLAACNVSIPVSRADEATALNQLARTRTGPRHIHLLWESTPLRANKLMSDFGQTQGARTLGLLVSPSDAVAEIVEALFDGVTLMDQLTDAGFSPRDVLEHIHFSFATSSDFFMTLAKLRAIRILWYQVIRAYGVDDMGYDKIFIHARCKPFNNDLYGPRASLISNTTNSIAAICGGCDALTIFPDENGSGLNGRIARNVSTILADEAHLDKVADPFAGSYFVETLIHDLAATAWKAFISRSHAK